MELIGKTTINPILFYSGKISGYINWILLFFALLNIGFINENPVKGFDIMAYVLMSAGVLLVIFSSINLGKQTRLGLPNTKTELKRNGIYKFSRNPMYAGFNLLTLSSMIYFLNLTTGLLGIYSIVIYHLIILGEEKFLEDRFGSDYTNYRKKVNRYL